MSYHPERFLAWRQVHAVLVYDVIQVASNCVPRELQETARHHAVRTCLIEASDVSRLVFFSVDEKSAGNRPEVRGDSVKVIG